MILFTIGGFSGLMLAIVPADFQYHDTYFVVAHFHYVLVTGALFGIIAARVLLVAEVDRPHVQRGLGKFHFWWTMVFVNLLFFPQHFLGLAGMPRRIPDYNVVFADWNLVSSIGAFGMFAHAVPDGLHPVAARCAAARKAEARVVGRRARPGVDGAVAGAAPHLHHAAGDPRRRPRPRRHHALSASTPLRMNPRPTIPQHRRRTRAASARVARRCGSR